ncbi:hypothetical protein [Nocardia iowensis]|uniref:DUF2336 domain-containing protein n=1 Tax=Nocardia iowensis TaxID=204891 RepID=A0ABX8RZM2_NOCIO|nr:hypothetical protein [Nocardia iowensis]QXN95154.1 hypothetical protein KV110_20215 [Nocardia iowensis]
MSEQLMARAETTKLARLLDISDPAELDFLNTLSPEAIRTFRERATDLLFDGDAARMKRVAAATKVVPTAISAKAAERAFGPILCAAVAGSVEPSRAIDIAKALPARFLAETAIQLDPRRTADIIAAVPARLVVEVARELLRIDDHVTMSRFVGVVPEESMRAAVPVLGDADLLRIGFLMEDKSALDRLMGLVTDRLAGVIRAAHDQDLWAEGLDLLDSVGPENRAALGDIAAGLGGNVLDGLIEAVRALDAWDSLLPVTSAMTADSLRAFAERPAVQEESVLASIMNAALNKGFWLDLLPLVIHLQPAQLATLAAHLAEKSDEELGDLVAQADTAGLWDAMLPIALAMTDTDRRRMAGLPIMRDPDVLRAVINTTAAHELWSQALPLVDALPDSASPILASCIGDLSKDQLLAAVLVASRSDNIDTLVAIALAQDPAGRARVLDIIDGMADLDEFLAALTPETPDVVWDGLIEVRTEIPSALRDQLAARADGCGRGAAADSLRDDQV